MLSVLQAADVAVYGDTDWTERELRDEWDELDLAHDAWLVELDGRLAGVAHLADRAGGRFIGDGYVHPELRGRGVGTRVLALIEERVRELEPSWPTGERIVLESAHLVGDERAPALHEGRGFIVRPALLPDDHRRGGASPETRLAGRGRGTPVRRRPATASGCTPPTRTRFRASGATWRGRTRSGGSGCTRRRASIPH